MKKQLLTSFYLEAVLLIAVFVAMILVLTGVFGAARTQSAAARRLTQAVTLAANAAEAVSAADSPEQAAALDDKLIAAWTGHPHFRVIDNSSDFEEKIRKFVATMTDDNKDSSFFNFLVFFAGF